MHVFVRGILNKQAIVVDALPTHTFQQIVDAANGGRSVNCETPIYCNRMRVASSDTIASKHVESYALIEQYLPGYNVMEVINC